MGAFWSKYNWGKPGQGLQLEVWVEFIGILPDGRLWPELSTIQTKDLQKWQGDSHARERCSMLGGVMHRSIGHDGTSGNEEADRQARREVDMGYRLQKPDIATPAGIKSEFPLYPKAPKHLGWRPRAIKGLVHMVTDKGPQQQWLWEIGRSENPACVCDGWTPQNAAHLRECAWVGDGKGRRAEMMWSDEEWCAAVEEFIH